MIRRQARMRKSRGWRRRGTSFAPTIRIGLPVSRRSIVIVRAIAEGQAIVLGQLLQRVRRRGLQLVAGGIDDVAGLILVSARELEQGLVVLEEAMRTRAAGMDDALGNAFMVKMGDLFPEDEILYQRTLSASRGALCRPWRNARTGSSDRYVLIGATMSFVLA